MGILLDNYRRTKTVLTNSPNVPVDLSRVIGNAEFIPYDAWMTANPQITAENFFAAWAAIIYRAKWPNGRNVSASSANEKFSYDDYKYIDGQLRRADYLINLNGYPLPADVEDDHKGLPFSHG